MAEIKVTETRDGRRFVVREAGVRDAAQLLEGAQAVIAERSDYLITQPEEFAIDIDEEKRWIQSFIDSENSVLMVAELESTIVGWASLRGSARLRKRHTALLGITVAKAWRGRGIGSALVQAILDWATKNETVEKIRLEVVAGNQRALGLYRRLGFLEEGRLPREIRKADGTYLDGFLMYRFVDSDQASSRSGSRE